MARTKPDADNAKSRRQRRASFHAGPVRTLLVLFGDQLNHNAAALRGLDPDQDAILLMEVCEEATHVPSHAHRTILFLSAMRHFADDLIEAGFRVRYVHLDDDGNTGNFHHEFSRAIEALEPSSVVCIRPGEWRVMEMVEDWQDAFDGQFLIEEDDHFFSSPAHFASWADTRKSLVLEHFYRSMRKEFSLLIDDEKEPLGGQWNFDRENRKPFKSETDDLPAPLRFDPDAITQDVIRLVASTFPGAPGDPETFAWPVTRADAMKVKRDFIKNRLGHFGTYQDAMVQGAPWMYHSLLSPMLNLKLLDPREVVEAAIKAYHANDAPINAVEGFVRQIVGWREFIRGVYWLEGPEYANRNSLDQHGSLPELYWTADTDMNCMHQCVSEVIAHGYGHHIQRLMVTGNFALIAGVHPREISDWYLGMYVDAIDWVTLPNTLGMVMHADGGIVGTKPYAAGGNYISKMSDYCKDCIYDPKSRVGDDACPFTTLYWDFLSRNRTRFSSNHRMTLALKNLDRFDKDELVQITVRARDIRTRLGMNEGSATDRESAGRTTRKQRPSSAEPG